MNALPMNIPDILHSFADDNGWLVRTDTTSTDKTIIGKKYPKEAGRRIKLDDRMLRVGRVHFAVLHKRDPRSQVIYNNMGIPVEVSRAVINMLQEDRGDGVAEKRANGYMNYTGTVTTRSGDRITKCFTSRRLAVAFRKKHFTEIWKPVFDALHITIPAHLYGDAIL